MGEIDEPGPSGDASTINASLEDPGAFEVLFDRHYDAIWRYVCRRAGAGLADELASAAASATDSKASRPAPTPRLAGRRSWRG